MVKKKAYVPPEIQVIMPYETLQELLSVAHSVEDLKQEIEHRDQQIAALRGQMVDVFDVIGQLREEIRLLD